MIAGCDRYFQIARCLRDEDLRADRQPEHTQIDLEMSFVTEDDVFAAVEGLFGGAVEGVPRRRAADAVPRLTFREAMQRFGSDKPDVRFGLEFADITAIHARSPRNVIADWRQAPRTAWALPSPSRRQPSTSGTQLRKYEDRGEVRAGGAGCSFFKVTDADREKQRGDLPRSDLLDEFLSQVKAQSGDAVVFTNGPWELTLRRSA